MFHGRTRGSHKRQLQRKSGSRKSLSRGAPTAQKFGRGRRLARRRLGPRERSSGHDEAVVVFSNTKAQSHEGVTRPSQVTNRLVVEASRIKQQSAAEWNSRDGEFSGWCHLYASGQVREGMPPQIGVCRS